MSTDTGRHPEPSSPAVGFRRNIKWFLAALVGFLITLILVLLLFLQTVLDLAARTERDQRNAAVSSARASIEAVGPDGSPGAIDGRLASLRASLGIAGIELIREDGTTIRSGMPGPREHSIRRPVQGGTLVLHFTPSPVEQMQDRFLTLAAIVIGATIVAGILLLLLLPRIVRPIDRMLEDARALGERDLRQSEDHYLIDTFRSSIERLQQQEQELRRLHEFEKARADDLERITATLTRSLSSGFIALDPSGRILDLNRAAREILRLDPGFELPDAVSTVLGEGPLASTILDVFARRHALTRHEIVDEQRAFVLGLTSVPLWGEEEEFLGMLVLFTDLSGVRDLEHRVREMQALADLGQIAAGIAHEFRNSLGTILGYLKLARRQTEQEQREEKIRQAEAEGLRLAASISGLLAFARPVHLELEQVDLEQAFREVSDRIGMAAGQARLTVESDGSSVEADRALLESVFENVLRNAVEAQPAGDAEVEVEIAARRDGVRIVVRDRGTGIPGDLLDRVFLPFQTGKASGTGLGLALARKIVILHGGTIGISSVEGRGTSVTIELPAQVAPVT